MAAKVRVAAESRDSGDFLIIARTDARTELGLDEALRRAETYLRAGADMLFIESPETVEDMRRIGRAFNVPLVANMVEGGRTPVLSGVELEELGYRFAIFPALGFLASGAAMERAFQGLLRDRASTNPGVPLYPFQAFSALMGMDRIGEFDRRYADAAKEFKP